MGRIPLGASAQYDHCSQSIRKKVIVRGRHRCLVPSRRRPLGCWSILGLKRPTGTVAEIQAAFKRLSIPHHPDRHITSTPHERSVHTRQYDQLVAARDAALQAIDRPPNNVAEVTYRVRVYRGNQTKREKQITTAVNSKRRQTKLARKKNVSAVKQCRNLNAPAIGRRCSQGVVVELLPVNLNNRITSAPWVVVERHKKLRQQDKRLGPYTALTVDEVV